MKKLKLSELKVQSFITSIDSNAAGTLKGGATVLRCEPISRVELCLSEEPCPGDSKLCRTINPICEAQEQLEFASRQLDPFGACI